MSSLGQYINSLDRGWDGKVVWSDYCAETIRKNPQALFEALQAEGIIEVVRVDSTRGTIDYRIVKPKRPVTEVEHELAKAIDRYFLDRSNVSSWERVTQLRQEWIHAPS